MRGKAFGFGLLFSVLGGGWLVRSQLGIEASSESVRTFVGDLGVLGPIAVMLLLAFRNVLFIPSQVILIAAGVGFGTLLGTLYGAVGLTFSGVLYFGFTRWLGRDALRARLSPRSNAVLEVVGERPGAVVLAGLTAYPIGILGLYWVFAAVSGMSWPRFLAAVSAGSIPRAGTYVFLGSSLLEGDTAQLAAAAALFAAVLALPLLSPGVRAWLGRIRSAARSPPGIRGQRSLLGR